MHSQILVIVIYTYQTDLSPTIGNLIVMEYIEECPPLFMTKDMTCHIVNYYCGYRFY